MANTIRSSLALAVFMLACGDDDGGGDDPGGGNKDAGSVDSGSVDSGTIDSGGGGNPDAGSYTLADALKTAGTDVSTARVNLLFEAACKEDVKCSKESQSSCQQTGLSMYNKGKSAGYDDTCLDATLDLYACFAQTACADFDAKCSNEAQFDACSKYRPDGGN